MAHDTNCIVQMRMIAGDVPQNGANGRIAVQSWKRD